MKPLLHLQLKRMATEWINKDAGLKYSQQLIRNNLTRDGLGNAFIKSFPHCIECERIKILNYVNVNLLMATGH